MSAWGGGNPGSGSNQSPFNPDSAMMGHTNPAAAGVGGSTGGGGGTLSVPQTPFAGGMQRPMGDAQQPQGPPQMGNWGNRQPQSMARPMGQMGMQGPPQGYPAMQRPPIQGGMGQPMQQQMGMQRPGMQQGMGQPMPPQQNGMPMPPSSILARMRSGGQGGPPSTGGPQPGMSNTRLAPPPMGQNQQQQQQQQMNMAQRFGGGGQMPSINGGAQGPSQAPPSWQPDPGQNYKSIANPNTSPMPQGLSQDQQSEWQSQNPSQIHQYAPATFPGQGPQAAPPPMQGQPTDNQDVNSMLRNSNNALAPAALGAQSYGR